MQTPRSRDRHGRGRRGPELMADPTSGAPARLARPTGKQRFDATVQAAARRLETRWGAKLGLVEYAVEEVPEIPANWSEPVPLSTLRVGAGIMPARIVVFRRPIEARCDNTTELAALVHLQLVLRIAELMGLPPHEVDPAVATDD